VLLREQRLPCGDSPDDWNSGASTSRSVLQNLKGA